MGLQSAKDSFSERLDYWSSSYRASSISAFLAANKLLVLCLVIVVCLALLLAFPTFQFGATSTARNYKDLIAAFPESQQAGVLEESGEEVSESSINSEREKDVTPLVTEDTPLTADKSSTEISIGIPMGKLVDPTSNERLTQNQNQEAFKMQPSLALTLEAIDRGTLESLSVISPETLVENRAFFEANTKSVVKTALEGLVSRFETIDWKAWHGVPGKEKDQFTSAQEYLFNVIQVNPRFANFLNSAAKQLSQLYQKSNLKNESDKKLNSSEIKEAARNIFPWQLWEEEDAQKSTDQGQEQALTAFSEVFADARARLGVDKNSAFAPISDIETSQKVAQQPEKQVVTSKESVASTTKLTKAKLANNIPAKDSVVSGQSEVKKTKSAKDDLFGEFLASENSDSKSSNDSRASKVFEKEVAPTEQVESHSDDSIFSIFTLIPIVLFLGISFFVGMYLLHRSEVRKSKMRSEQAASQTDEYQSLIENL